MLVRTYLIFIDHFFSKTWCFFSRIAQSYTKLALIIKGLRRRPKYNFAQLKYRYFHYMVRLEEGPAPGKEGLYGPKLPELKDRMNKRLDRLNDRKLLGTIA